MKRVNIPLAQFLTELIPVTSLRPAERNLLEQARTAPTSHWVESLTRQLIESLIERGAFVVLERRTEGDDEHLVVRDPERRIRFSFTLPQSARGPAVRRIPLPLDPPASSGLKHHQVQDLLTLQSNLIASGRVMGPRDLVTRFPQILKDQVPAERVEFHPLEMPPGEDWPQVAWDQLPASRPELELLGRDRDHVLLVTALPDGRSSLFLGIGDEATGWRGLLQLESGGTDPFPTDRIALALLLAQHFRGLFSTLVRLQGLIFYDYLTGIYNRTYYEEQLEREISLARRRSQSMALLIADIDDFKAFNTRYGYDGGDRVLATVACVLKAALRTTDTLARYGGEEFVVILAPPVPVEEARRIAERLRSAVAEEPIQIKPLEGEARLAQVTISIGGAMHPDGGRTARDLWNAANRALLEAKGRGKNRALFSSDLVSPAEG